MLVDWSKAGWRFYDDEEPYREVAVISSEIINFPACTPVQLVQSKGITHGWLKFPGLTVSQFLMEMNQLPNREDAVAGKITGSKKEGNA